VIVFHAVVIELVLPLFSSLRSLLFGLVGFESLCPVGWADASSEYFLPSPVLFATIHHVRIDPHSEMT
jgi:hypothetical protein